MNGRHELKHYINVSDYAQLRARLRAVAKLDENAGADGGYIIRSLYFDNNHPSLDSPRSGQTMTVELLLKQALS